MACNFHLYRKRNEIYEGSLVTVWPEHVQFIEIIMNVYEIFVGQSQRQRPLRKTGLVIRMTHTWVCCCVYEAVSHMDQCDSL
jgi:hypothetical protein